MAESELYLDARELDFRMSAVFQERGALNSSTAVKV